MSKNGMLSDKDWLALRAPFEKSVRQFEGNSEVLENAWGALLVGTQVGWRVSYIIHNQATIKKYEEVTGLRFRDLCEPETELSKKSLGYKVARKLSSIWKAIRGEESIPDRGMLANK